DQVVLQILRCDTAESLDPADEPTRIPAHRPQMPERARSEGDATADVDELSFESAREPANGTQASLRREQKGLLLDSAVQRFDQIGQGDDVAEHDIGN